MCALMRTLIEKDMDPIGTDGPFHFRAFKVALPPGMIQLPEDTHQKRQAPVFEHLAQGSASFLQQTQRVSILLAFVAQEICSLCQTFMLSFTTLEKCQNGS